MQVTLRFGKPGYIAHPYWPEMYQLIEIQKRSGVNRTRSEANRRRALESYLNETGMRLEEYQELERAAKRPFHQNGAGIFIPGARILDCLVSASDEAPAKLRLPNLRVAISAGDFETGKLEADGYWERFAVVTGAQGKLSNQRAFRSNAYIADFDAVGELRADAQMVEPKAIRALLEFAGRVKGIGASRKMGWGRFAVTSWIEA